MPLFRHCAFAASIAMLLLLEACTTQIPNTAIVLPSDYELLHPGNVVITGTNISSSGDSGDLAPFAIYKYATVTTYFATDRSIVRGERAVTYGTERAELTYGSVEISIPRDHQMGKLEERSLWRGEIFDDPGKHVLVLKVSPTTWDSLRLVLASKMATAPKASAFIYVHGYHVTFIDAARRTAQMAYDLGFKGAPIFYSWPSKGETIPYFTDGQSAEWTESHLEEFLTQFLSQTNVEEVYLIAHSMGSRPLARALASLYSAHPELAPRIKQVILAAPDIDADVFRQQIAPALVARGRPITLYASSNDKALKASKQLQGQGSYPRAGEAGSGLVVLHGIETVDATNVETDFIGHSAFATTKTILSDIYYIMKTGAPASQRFGLKPVSASSGVYWQFAQ